MVALGETGLDCHWDFAPLELQVEWLRRHLRLAKRTGLPAIVHCRDAAADLLPILQEEAAARLPALLMHAFSGDETLAVKCLELGMFLSFAGNATYANKKFQSLRAAAVVVPADRILIETDCPYLTPEPFRGRQRNEPALAAHTAACLAGLRGVSVAQFAAETTANARRIFGRLKAEG